jgi:hypothetical protein
VLGVAVRLPEIVHARINDGVAIGKTETFRQRKGMNHTRRCMQLLRGIWHRRAVPAGQVKTTISAEHLAKHIELTLRVVAQKRAVCGVVDPESGIGILAYLHGAP